MRSPAYIWLGRAALRPRFSRFCVMLRVYALLMATQSSSAVLPDQSNLGSI
jgi:hypothetical protein